jgi:hypothetical protein
MALGLDLGGGGDASLGDYTEIFIERLKALISLKNQDENYTKNQEQT